MRGREIISLPVISLESREMLGEVKDILYDPYANQVLALVVEDGGWFKGARVILFDQVSQIKSDGVYVACAQAILDTNESDEHRRLWQDKVSILGHKYIDSQGEEMGTIEDLLVDHYQGRITGYELSNGVIEDLLSGRVNVEAPNNFIIDNQVLTVVTEDGL